MAEKIIMPKQGLQMTEGTVTKWLVGRRQGGNRSAPFRDETDKSTIQIDSTAAGEVLKLVARRTKPSQLPKPSPSWAKRARIFPTFSPKRREEKETRARTRSAAPAAPAVKSAPAADDTTPIALEGRKNFLLLPVPK